MHDPAGTHHYDAVGQFHQLVQVFQGKLSIDSVRLSDGRTIPLRATREKGEGDMSGASTTNFNTGTQELIQLKEAGVNDNIIKAMVQKSGRR
jgi:hypothetical protein